MFSYCFQWRRINSVQNDTLFAHGSPIGINCLPLRWAPHLHHLYDVHYRILLNHFSHKIDLIMNTDKKFVYGVKVLSEEKKQFYYLWHVEKGDDQNCNNCWFTSGVSMPTDQGNSI